MGKISVELIASETDPPLRSSEYQAGLKNVASALQTANAKVSFRMFMQDAIGAPSFLEGGFTIENVKSVKMQLVPHHFLRAASRLKMSSQLRWSWGQSLERGFKLGTVVRSV